MYIIRKRRSLPLNHRPSVSSFLSKKKIEIFNTWCTHIRGYFIKRLLISVHFNTLILKLSCNIIHLMQVLRMKSGKGPWCTNPSEKDTTRIRTDPPNETGHPDLRLHCYSLWTFVRTHRWGRVWGRWRDSCVGPLYTQSSSSSLTGSTREDQVQVWFGPGLVVLVVDWRSTYSLSFTYLLPTYQTMCRSRLTMFVISVQKLNPPFYHLYPSTKEYDFFSDPGEIFRKHLLFVREEDLIESRDLKRTSKRDSW